MYEHNCDDEGNVMETTVTSTMAATNAAKWW